jgi:hypothetical protein
MATRSGISSPVHLFEAYGPPRPSAGQKPDPEAVEAQRQRARIIMDECAEARIWRAVESLRQLHEVIVQEHAGRFAQSGRHDEAAEFRSSPGQRPVADRHLPDMRESDLIASAPNADRQRSLLPTIADRGLAAGARSAARRANADRHPRRPALADMPAKPSGGVVKEKPRLSVALPIKITS